MIMAARGASIVEFLISITLGVLLMGSLLSVYLSNKRTQTTQQALATVQENARFVNHQLTASIRNVGLQGCAQASAVSINSLVTNPPADLNLDQPLLGYQSTGDSWSPALPTTIAGKVVAGNDVLVIQKAASGSVHLSTDMDSASDPIDVYNKMTLLAGDMLLISDCENADLFVAGTSTNNTLITHPSGDNTTASLSKSYQNDAEVIHYQWVAFFVKDSGRTNAAGQPLYSLVQQDITGNETELADGIEQLRFTYGVDSDGDGNVDSVLDAAGVTAADQWPNVVSVRAQYRLVSNQADKPITRQFESYIALRNRSL